MRDTRAGLLVACVGTYLAFASWTASCGGEAIVDDVAAGGAGASSSSSSSGDGSPICYTPPPVGSIGPCSSSGGAFGPNLCVSSSCDEAGNEWRSECDYNSCNCYYKGELQCTCLDEGPPGSCAECCPSPFPP